ncbi:MAG: hypothetical protein RL677_673 [Actinomycetota bacterium]
MQVFSVADIRQAEQELIAKLPERALMERAAFGLASFISQLSRASELTPNQTEIVAIIGKGNNGQDCIVAGEYLTQKGFSFSSVLHTDNSQKAKQIVKSANIVLDGIVGLGSASPISETARNLFNQIQKEAVLIAVDLPSGVNPDTGEVYDENFCPKANYTVTFGALKLGLITGKAKSFTGDLHFVDIGLAPYLKKFSPIAVLPDEKDLKKIFPKRTSTSHKYSKGVVAINAGSKNYPGAALLTIEGSLASGIGMVTYLGDADQKLIKKFPQVIYGATNQSKVTASVLGPGQSKFAKNYLNFIENSKELILDATAIQLLARKEVNKIIANKNIQVLITPHEKEAKDLCQVLKIPYSTNRVKLAKDLAKATGAICLLKGPGAIVANPNYDFLLVDQFGDQALATAGSGDLLAGLIGAIAADPKTSLSQAAILGLAILGKAGQLAKSFAPEPALDLVAQSIPTAISELVS